MSDKIKDPPKKWDMDCPIVYGPLPSRRFGFSLGINLLPENRKHCNFDCLYCQCGWTDRNLLQSHLNSVGFPSLSDLETSIHREFERLHQEGIAPDTIVFSGNGEPTLYPEFSRAVELVRQARNDYLPSSLLGILTNGTMLGEKVVFDAVAGLEIKCLKLDAGNLWMDRPCTPYSLDQLIPLWRDIPDLTIQSFFCEGQFENTRKEWVDLWIEQLKMINPARLQIYTLARQAPVSTMQKARAETLQRIAARVREEMSLELQVFF